MRAVRKQTKVRHHPEGCGLCDADAVVPIPWKRPRTPYHHNVFTVTDALVKAVNALRSKVIPARAIDEIDRDKNGKIHYPSATGPWVRLPQGSILVVEERGDDLVAVLTGSDTGSEETDLALLTIDRIHA